MEERNPRSPRTRNWGKRGERFEGSGIYLSSKIFEDGGEIDRSTGSNTFGVLAGLEKTGNTTDGELESGLAATRLSLLRSSGTKSLSTAGHLFNFSGYNG